MHLTTNYPPCEPSRATSLSTLLKSYKISRTLVISYQIVSRSKKLPSAGQLPYRITAGDALSGVFLLDELGAISNAKEA
jgi:hypothetical protein